MIDPQSQLALVSRLMDVAALRNDVIAQNVANVNTPGYQAMQVQFEEELARAMAQNGDRGTTVKPQVVAGGGAMPRSDGNNVDIDQEMGRLHKNSILFQLFAQFLSTQLSQYRSAIQGH